VLGAAAPAATPPDEDPDEDEDDDEGEAATPLEGVPFASSDAGARNAA
jgi:hypothetical protein